MNQSQFDEAAEELNKRVERDWRSDTGSAMVAKAILLLARVIQEKANADG